MPQEQPKQTYEYVHVKPAEIALNKVSNRLVFNIMRRQLYGTLWHLMTISLFTLLTTTEQQTTDATTTAALNVQTNQIALDTDHRYLFRSSMCYDVTGRAVVRIGCPAATHGIESTLAFTAVSQTNRCAYEAWDCILQEGSTQECDARDSCTVVAQYDQRRHDVFRCGDNGTTMFLQVEYYCASGKRRSIKFHDVLR